MARAIALSRFAGIAAALSEVASARKDIPLDGRYLSSDEAAALAEGWEFQAADDLYRGYLKEGLEDLAIAEQILDGRPEHREHRGRICAQIAAQLSATTPDLRSVKAEYLATARDLLAGSDKYHELLEALRYTRPALPATVRLYGLCRASSVGPAQWGQLSTASSVRPAQYGQLSTDSSVRPAQYG
jgi:hypothetical protein